MGAPARLGLALAAILAADASHAQQIPHIPGQIPPYVDPNNPPFQLPPGPSDPLDRLYPGPLRPDPPLDRQTPVPDPFPRSLTPREGAAYPQGFTMTINRDSLSMASGDLIRPRQIAEHLAACWQPPAEGSEVTVRVSFSRNGAVIGKPRVTYVKPGQGADRASVVGSLEQAFARCAPLRLSADLGSAIAGRPFAIRFIAPGASRP